MGPSHSNQGEEHVQGTKNAAAQPRWPGAAVGAAGNSTHPVVTKNDGAEGIAPLTWPSVHPHQQGLRWEPGRALCATHTPGIGDTAGCLSLPTCKMEVSIRSEGRQTLDDALHRNAVFIPQHSWEVELWTSFTV